MRKLLFFIPLAVFLLLVVGLGLKLESPAVMSTASPLLHKPFPIFTLPALSSGQPPFDSARFKGKLVLVNVFASWCASCAIEHPLLLELSQRSRLPIYGLNWKDKNDKALNWLAERGNPYAEIGADKTGRIAVELGITGAPETWLVDKNGIIIYHLAGTLTPQIIEEELLPLIAGQ